MESVGATEGQRAYQKRLSLPTIDRSIRAENQAALTRRWRLAVDEASHAPGVFSRWFPGQRHLFSVLSVMTEQQVSAMADTGTPLFQLRLPSRFDGMFAETSISDSLERQNVDEGFMALLSRLDSLRTAYQQACVLLDLNKSSANFISKFTPAELRGLACDPAVMLLPTVSDEFFTVAAMQRMTFRERTIYAGITRRVRELLH